MISSRGNCEKTERQSVSVLIETRSTRDPFHSDNYVSISGSGPTQETVVRVGLEELLGAVQVETERQEDLYVGLLLQQALVDLVRALQLAYANGVVTLPVALRVQWVEHLIKVEIIANAQFTLFTGGYYIQEGVGWSGFALMQHRQQVELNNAKVTWRVSD